MPIRIASRRRSAASLAKAFPGAQIVDVTSKAAEPWVRLSPFYPHGGIPVPQTPGATGQSVEGIWQALKVFETTDVDLTKLDITTMTGLKRTVRRYGQVRGHRDGLHGERLLSYETARRRIYLPAYRWVLENKTTDLIEHLRDLADEQEVLLLDYTTNGEVTNPRTPLSHAALVRLYLQNEWPDEDDQSEPQQSPPS
ncbi:hypothetical protein AB0F17_15765 [Nonomuraea sp. NPDC026600]|uniref:DUF6939 family protein n=1 Tax=Nonomuraea sp. NPDC026600 TaxID=3155363 RepID=UPI0033DDA218